MKSFEFSIWTRKLAMAATALALVSPSFAGNESEDSDERHAPAPHAAQQPTYGILLYKGNELFQGTRPHTPVPTDWSNRMPPHVADQILAYVISEGSEVGLQELQGLRLVSKGFRNYVDWARGQTERAETPFVKGVWDIYDKLNKDYERISEWKNELLTAVNNIAGFSAQVYIASPVEESFPSGIRVIIPDNRSEGYHTSYKGTRLQEISINEWILDNLGSNLEKLGDLLVPTRSTVPFVRMLTRLAANEQFYGTFFRTVYILKSFQDAEAQFRTPEFVNTLIVLMRTTEMSEDGECAYSVDVEPWAYLMVNALFKLEPQTVIQRLNELGYAGWDRGCQEDRQYGIWIIDAQYVKDLVYKMVETWPELRETPQASVHGRDD